MGKYKDENGTTRVGDFLRKNAPHILDIAGDVLPDAGALGVIKNLIQNDNKMPPSVKLDALKLLELDLKNTEGARKMQIAALNQEDKFSKRFIYYLAIFWSLIGASYIFFATFVKVENPHVLDVVLGFLLGTIVATIINFFFGSSGGSKEKTNGLLNIIKK